MERRRLKPETRFEELITVALELAKTVHFLRLTPLVIAKAAHCSPGLVTHYLGKAPVLRATILREAIKRGHTDVVGQGEAIGHIEPGGVLCPALAALEYRCPEYYVGT